MIYLKEDGSLDVERINQLPLEEWMDLMGLLTQEQIKEYNSKLPIVETNEPMRAVEVDYSFDDKRSGIDANSFLNKMKKKYITK